MHVLLNLRSYAITCVIYMHQVDMHQLDLHVDIYIYQNAFLAHRRDPRTMKRSDTAPKP